MVGAVIQVRLSSTRLPEKAKLYLNGLSVIERVILNAKEIIGADKVIISTTNEPIDIEYFSNIAEKNNVSIFTGDKDDVIKRFIDTAEAYNLQHIVRVTGDCPLFSYEGSSILIKEHLTNNNALKCEIY